MSIQKIANLVGTSNSTVSRILNNPEYHPQDKTLRDKVWKAAMQLNYVPNESARNLKKKSNPSRNNTKYIQVLLTRTEKNQADPFFTELLHIVESQIHEKNCILTQVWYESLFSDDTRCMHLNLSGMIEDLYQETEGKSDGLIVIGRCNTKVLELLKKQFKNIVSINRNSTNREVDEVTCDGEKIASMAVEYLFECRHQKIGYVGPCKGESRYRGFINTLMKHEAMPDPAFIYDTKQTEAAGYEVMEKLLQSDDYPTAIYCTNDIIAIGMLKAKARFRNKYINISIISSDDIEQAQYTKPMLTTVALPKQEMARFAVALLLSRINGEHSCVVTMELQGRLINRESCVDVEYSKWNYYI